MAQISRPADFDVGFGSSGKVLTPIGVATEDIGRAIALQPDAKILLAGSSVNVGNDTDFAVVRYNANGTLDTSFGAGGKVVVPLGIATEDQCNALALQADGKILLAGYSNAGSGNRFAIVRLLPNGLLDTSFGSGGILVVTVGTGGNDQARGVAVQNDGNILLGGSAVFAKTDYALIRLLPNGTLDSSFGSGGVVRQAFESDTEDQARALLIQPDQRIILVGSSTKTLNSDTDFALMRFLPSGALDPSFGSGGMVTTPLGMITADLANAAALTSDGRIVVAGYRDLGNNRDFAAVRYLPSGVLDLTFGAGGIATVNFGAATADEGRAVLVQPDGKVVVIGQSIGPDSDTDFAVARLLPNGDLDPTFGSQGRLLVPFGPNVADRATCGALQPDGRITMAGSSLALGDTDFALVRLIGYADTDGDGFDDGFEIYTGYDPLSAASNPALWAQFLPSFEFRFASARERLYRIETSTDLQVWTVIETDVLGYGTFTSRFYQYDVPKRFYRARLQP